MDNFKFDSQFYKRVICENPSFSLPPSFDKILEKAVEKFYEEFDYYPDVASCAPGTLSIFGEHTENKKGILLQTAIPLFTVIVAKRSRTLKCCVITTSQNADAPNKVVFPSQSYSTLNGFPKWANYIKGILKNFHKSQNLVGFDAVVHSTVPERQGLGSSAALQTAFYVLLEEICGAVPRLNADIKARNCMKAEETCKSKSKSGRFDCFTSLVSKSKHLVRIDTRYGRSKLVPMRDPNVLFLLIKPNHPALEINDTVIETRNLETLIALKYLNLKCITEVREEHLDQLGEADDIDKELVVKILTEDVRVNDENVIGQILTSLFDSEKNGQDRGFYPLDECEEFPEKCSEVRTVYVPLEHEGESTETLAVRQSTDQTSLTDSLSSRSGAGGKLQKRLRYWRDENARAVDIQDDIARTGYACAGQKISHSYLSVKCDYEISCPALESLVESCLEIQDVYGAKITRGNQILTLLNRNAVERVVDHLKSKYDGELNYTCVCPCDGAKIIKLPGYSVKTSLSDVYLTREQLTKQAVDMFQSEFDRVATVASYAPGSVNILGDHADYHQGYVLSFALPLGTVVVGSENRSAVIRLTTTADVSGNRTCIQIPEVKRPSPGKIKWVNYVIGVVANFNGYVPGFDALIHTSLPLDSGLSSSSALEAAVFTFLEQLSTPVQQDDIADKAYACMKSEHEFTKNLCGNGHQTVAFGAQEGHAVFLDCRSTCIEHIPIADESVAFLITVLPISDAEDSDSRSQMLINKMEECYHVCNVLGVTSLRDVELSDLAELETGKIKRSLLRRARYVVGENKRVLESAEALKSGDLGTLGELMFESHLSLRNEYEASSVQSDRLVQTCLQIPGVYGSCVVGNHSALSTVTLLKKWAVDKAIEVISYDSSPTDDKIKFYVVEASSGCAKVDVNGLATKRKIPFEAIFPI